MKILKSTVILAVLILAITLFPKLDTEVSAMENENFAKCRVPTFAETLKDSKLIFAGKILSERTEGSERIFTFQAEKYWKGKAGKTVEVRYFETMRYQIMLQVGEKYLVYAKGNENGTLTDGRCSLTKKYAEAKSELKKLGKGKTVK